MPHHPTQARQLMGGVGILALVGSALALAAPATAAECRTYTMQHNDPNTLNLKDGEHVIASVNTVAGKLEARVAVKGKEVSDPRLFLGGKPLQNITESQIPKEVRECIQKQKGALPSGSWLADAARGGELGQEVPEAQLPESLRGCLQTAALSSGSRSADAARSILDWIVPPAYAAKACSKRTFTMWTVPILSLDGKTIVGWRTVVRDCCGNSCSWASF